MTEVLHCMIHSFMFFYHNRPNQENHHDDVSNTIGHHLQHAPRATQIEQNQTESLHKIKC